MYNRIQKILSYLYPIRLKEIHSLVSGRVELNLVDGRMILDTDDANYSYGSLQKILHRGLQELNFPSNIQRVLVLGLGGGSIVETIRVHFKSDAFIELVEIDPAMVSLANDIFKINQYANLRIVCADATQYVKESHAGFDLIVVDLFVNHTIPEYFTQSDFLLQVKQLLLPGGRILFNTFNPTMPTGKLDEMKLVFEGSGLKTHVLRNVLLTNSLIICEA